MDGHPDHVAGFIGAETMSSRRAIVVDDEPLARQRLARLLKECGWEAVSVHSKVSQLLEALEGGLEADALFLDIEMPGGNGLEALAELPKPIPVIFVTAYPQHAAQAFDVDAVDYLVKPVFKTRLEKSLEKLTRHVAAEAAPSSKPAPASTAAKSSDTRFPGKAAGGTFFLDARKVTYFEFEDYAVWAWVGSHRFRAPWDSLGRVEESFPALPFIRIQRHLLIRSEAILSLRSLPGGRVAVRLVEGPELEVSRSMTPRVRELLGLKKT
jgi:DNA-binding LytR/AlgR family response regulator